MPSTRAACRASVVLASVLAALGLLLAGCHRQNSSSRQADPYACAPGEFSVMTFNLGRYSLDDRDGDGQKNDAKPGAERQAVVGLIADQHPDVLVVVEIGSPGVFEELCFALQNAGLTYPHTEYLQRGQSEINIAVLSRFPITDRQPHTDDTYSIGPAEIPVLRGFVEVEIEPAAGYRFRLLAAHLKSKVFHQLGQTEMRRNEARLLNKHVRRILKVNPDANLLVLGDFNDTYQSAALREITGEKSQYLRDLRPQDREGDVWTHFERSSDQYARIDYILASQGMLNEAVLSKTRAVRDERIYMASDHRPIMAVFQMHDVQPTLQEKQPGTPALAVETETD